MDLGIAKKTALVMGASKGLGAATAQTLAREGANVIAAARSVDVIEAWRAKLPSDAAARVTAAKLDTADLSSVDALADMLLAKGGVDILVLNTGGPPPGVAVEIGRELWIKQFEAMAANLFHITSRLLPKMRERKWGRIVTIASSGLDQPIPNLALSNGVRAAVLGWSKTLASEVAADGVNVNIVMPGRIQTERIGQLDEANAKRQNKSREEITESAKAQIPSGRYGDPQEFANMVCFLCSEPASYVTGIKIRVDGGLVRSL